MAASELISSRRRSGEIAQRHGVSDGQPVVNKMAVCSVRYRETRQVPNDKELDLSIQCADRRVPDNGEISAQPRGGSLRTDYSGKVRFRVVLTMRA